MGTVDHDLVTTQLCKETMDLLLPASDRGVTWVGGMTVCIFDLEYTHSLCKPDKLSFCALSCKVFQTYLGSYLNKSSDSAKLFFGFTLVH